MTPEAPQQPPPPPNPAVFANASVQAAGSRVLNRPNQGWGSTLVTGGQGLQSPARTGGKSLLGQ